ncbi:MAG: hypothetical protein ABI954_14325 [Pyrinomonadaceae bacterium]
MKNKQTKVDPKLTSQLDRASADQSSVQAVFTLDLPKKKLLQPDEVQAATERVLQRVEQNVGTKAQDYNVFRNLGAFAVEADEPFIRALIDEPEIASATANQQSDAAETKKTRLITKA